MKRQALVLGGTGGIGTAIVSALSNHFGDDVLAAGHKLCDLSTPASIDAFLGQYGTHFDVLIHCAGINPIGPFELFTDETIAEVMRINCTGLLRLIRGLLPHWKSTGKGHIVVISSLYGFLSRAGRLPYAISKHALMGTMKTLALEVGPIGVLVNAVSPGYIETELTRKNNSATTMQQLKQGIPIGRLGSPEEVAYAVCCLANPLNTYITGHNLIVDGGYSIGGFQR